MVRDPVIAAIGVAHPPLVSQDELWHGFFAGHYAGAVRGLAKRIFEHAGVTTRHGAVNPVVEDPSMWSTAQRMDRFVTEAVPLGKEAVATALARADVAASDVGMLVVCSCTGYATPGLDILLARDLGLPADARRLFVGHMGCYAALPGLGVVADYVALYGRPAVLVCVELPSLHVQPPTADPQQVVAHALFSDAAAAAVVVAGGSAEPMGSGAGATDTAAPAPGPLSTGSVPTAPTAGRVAEIAALTDTATADHMTWHVTDLGFRMGLSPQVPQVLSRHVRPLASGLLERHGLASSDVRGWAVHPGGPRILDVVESGLGLDSDALAPSRACLAAHGNCSSPTVLLILDQLLSRRAEGPVMMLAFGPGLTLYGALLR